MDVHTYVKRKIMIFVTAFPVGSECTEDIKEIKTLYYYETTQALVTATHWCIRAEYTNKQNVIFYSA